MRSDYSCVNIYGVCTSLEMKNRLLYRTPGVCRPARADGYEDDRRRTHTAYSSSTHAPKNIRKVVGDSWTSPHTHVPGICPVRIPSSLKKRSTTAVREACTILARWSCCCCCCCRILLIPTAQRLGHTPPSSRSRQPTQHGFSYVPVFAAAALSQFL